MQTINNKRFSFAMLFALIAVLSLSLVSCNKDDSSDETILEAFGPSPVALGGKVTFIGRNLDKVASIEFPMGYTVSTFDEKSSSKIVVTATADSAYAYEGLVKLILSDGKEVVSKSKIGYYQSALVNGFSPAEVKPDNELTLQGVYLSSVKSITFAGGVTVNAEDFVSQKNGTIVVKVPATAVSGVFTVTDGTNTLESPAELKITLPEPGSIEDKAYKPGVDVVTLTGKDMDLVYSVVFDGAEVLVFNSKTPTALSFELPVSAKPGQFSVTTASMITIPAVDIKMVAPITDPIVHNHDEIQDDASHDIFDFIGEKVVVSGTDLDLITSVKVGKAAIDDFEVSADGKSISFVLSNTATNDVVLTTANGTEVNAPLTVKAVDPNGAYWSFDTDGEAKYYAGKKVTITNCRNMQYATGARMGDVAMDDFKVAEDGKSFSFAIPSYVKGKQQLYVAATNGTEAHIWNVEVVASTTPYITYVPAECLAGGSIKILGGNFDKVTTVMVGEKSASFALLSESQLFVDVPTGMEEGDYTVIVGDAENNSFESLTTFALGGAKKFDLNGVITDGTSPITSWPYTIGWGGPIVKLTVDDYKSMKMVPGKSQIIIHNEIGKKGNVQLFGGEWGDTLLDGGQWDETSDTYVIELTEEMDAVFKQVGFLIQGTLEITGMEIIP